MTKKQKKMLGRILLAAVLLLVVKLLPPISLPAAIPLLSVSGAGEGTWTLSPWPLYLIPYLIIGWDVLWRAIRNIANGQVFDENFLMALATVGAFGTGEYSEAVFVMLFYQVGELFQDYAVGKSRQSIAALMDIRPDTANLEAEDGSIQEVDPEDVAVGDVIVVKPGERVPLDGQVLEGTSALDTAALTGESVPRDVVARGRASSAAASTRRAFSGYRSPRPARSPRCPRFWTWWRTPARKKPPASTSSPASPGTTPPAW